MSQEPPTDWNDTASARSPCLPYESVRAQQYIKCRVRAIIILLLLAAPLAMGSAFWAAGLGHGTMVPATLLFPAPVFCLWTWHIGWTALVLLTASQFPVYACMIWIAGRVNRLRLGIIVLIVCHFALAAVCLIIRLIPDYWHRILGI